VFLSPGSRRVVFDMGSQVKVGLLRPTLRLHRTIERTVRQRDVLKFRLRCGTTGRIDARFFSRPLQGRQDMSTLPGVSPVSPPATHVRPLRGYRPISLSFAGSQGIQRPNRGVADIEPYVVRLFQSAATIKFLLIFNHQLDVTLGRNSNMTSAPSHLAHRYERGALGRDSQLLSRNASQLRRGSYRDSEGGSRQPELPNETPKAATSSSEHNIHGGACGSVRSSFSPVGSDILLFDFYRRKRSVITGDHTTSDYCR